MFARLAISNKIFAIICAVFAGSAILLAFSARAQEIMATVNISNAKIVFQKENSATISFTISNREGIQSGVRYGVQLITETQKEKFTIDEKVYEETLTLAEHSSLEKEITYTAPTNLSGIYAVYLASNTKNGFPLAFVRAGEITLTGGAAGVVIIPESCFLTVENEKGSPKYTLSQGVDIAPDENLRLSCLAQNTSATALSAIPSFETRYRNAYGEIASHEGGTTAQISFTARQKKEISLLLPKAKEPQSYDIKFSLKSGDISSNAINIHYVIQGKSATILNILPDKNYYQRGETAIVSFLGISSAGDFPGSRKGTDDSSAINFEIIMTNSRGGACAGLFRGVLVEGSKTKAELPVLSECRNPKVSVSLVDEGGNILAREEVELMSPQGPEKRGTIVIILTILVIMGLVGSVIYLIKNKNGQNPLFILIPFLLISFAGIVMPLEHAQADTVCFTQGTGPGADLYCRTQTINDQSTLYPLGGGQYVQTGGTNDWHLVSCGNRVASELQSYYPSPPAGGPFVPPGIKTVPPPPLPPPAEPKVNTLSPTNITSAGFATMHGEGKAEYPYLVMPHIRLGPASTFSCENFVPGGDNFEIPITFSSGSNTLNWGVGFQHFSSTIGNRAQGVTYSYCAVLKKYLSSDIWRGETWSFTMPWLPPGVTTGAAAYISPTSYRIFGTTSFPSNAAPTYGFFRYGTSNPGTCSDSFGTKVPAISQGISPTYSSYSAAYEYNYDLTGLTPGATYYYCALATNIGGTGYGSVQSLVVPTGRPTVTTNPATSVGATAVTLNGLANPNSSSAIGWFYYRKIPPFGFPMSCNPNESGVTKIPVQYSEIPLGAGSSAVPYSVQLTGLTPNSTYNFCAVASNSAGTGSGNVLSFYTNPNNRAPNPPAITPNPFSGSTNTSHTFTFAATDPDNNHVRYQVDWNNDGTGDILLPNTNPATYVMSGFSQSSAYSWPDIGTKTFKARTQDTQGAFSGWTTHTVTITAPPSTPSVTTEAATGVSATSATLNGTGNPNNAQTTGWFRYGTVYPSGGCNDSFGTRTPSSGGTNLNNGSSPVAYSNNISGLTIGITYYFCAIASNSSGTGYGNVLSFSFQNPAVDGACGSAHGGYFFYAPAEPPAGTLCSAGTPDPNPATTNSTTFNWNCRGLNGGGDANPPDGCFAGRVGQPTVSLSTAPASPVSIGVPFSLNWTLGNSPSSCTASSLPVDSEWNGVLPPGDITNGSHGKSVTISVNTTFILSCTNPTGTTVSSISVQTNWVSGDGTCDKTKGENFTNSPQDCPITIEEF